MFKKKMKNHIYNYIGKIAFMILTMNSNKKYIILNRGMGDTFYFCALYTQSSTKNYNVDILIANIKHKDIIDEYLTDQNIKIKYTTSLLLYSINQYIKIMKIQKDNVKYIIPNNAEIILKNGKTILDFQRELLGLDSEIMPLRSEYNKHLSKASFYLEKMGLSKKYVVIAPGSFALESVSSYFWDKLIEFFFSLGYAVLINGYGSRQSKLPNVYNMNYSLGVTYNIINESEYFISARSGLCDLMSLSGVKMIVIYSDKQAKDMFSINKIYRKIKADELIYTNVETSLSEIKNILKKNKEE